MKYVRQYREWLTAPEQEERFTLYFFGSIVIVGLIGAAVGWIFHLVDQLGINIVGGAVFAVIFMAVLIAYDDDKQTLEEADEDIADLQRRYSSQLLQVNMMKSLLNGKVGLTIVQPEQGGLSETKGFRPKEPVHLTWCNPGQLSFTWTKPSGEVLIQEVLANKGDQVKVFVKDGKIQWELTPFPVFESVLRSS